MTVQTLTYRCPHCQKPVEAEPREDDQLMVCPHPDCGRPFRAEVPSAEALSLDEAAALNGSARALESTNGHAASIPPATASVAAATVVEPPMAQVPTASTIAAARAETALGTIKPAMFRRYPFRFTGYVSLILGGFVAAVIALVQGQLWLIFLAIAAAGYGAFRLVRWWLRNRNTSLTVTKDLCILRTGVVNTVTTEVPLAEIKDVQVNQTLINRIMKVGDIVLITSGEGTLTMMVMGMPNPQEIARMMRTQAA